MNFRFWCVQCEKMMFANENTAIYYWLNDEIYLIELTEKTDNELVHEGWNVCLACCVGKYSATSWDDFDPEEHEHIMMPLSNEKDTRQQVIWHDDVIHIHHFQYNLIGQSSGIWVDDYKRVDIYAYMEMQYINHFVNDSPYARVHADEYLHVVGNWHEHPELREKCE